MSSENLSAPYKKGDFIGGKYEVYGILGMGGFGIVYLVGFGKEPFALKTLRDEYLKDKEMQERFKKEAQIWIDLERHPYLVKADHVEKISDRFLIAIEYIASDKDGLNSLDGYLKHRPPDLAQSLRWAIQFCYGMEYAYSKGIRAHRDIKPANIMIGVDKAVKITDFGFAGLIGNARISGIRLDIRNNTVGFSCQTIEGSGFGTPTHMSPEQFTNAASCDERSDTYSFGIVLYQMATGGNLPFLPNLPKNNSDDEYIRFWRDMHRLHSSVPVAVLNSPLYPIIQKCLEKEPMRRYQSFRELRSELEPLLKRLTGEVIKVPEQRELKGWEWVNKGFSLSHLGKYQEALYCYDRAIETTPSLADKVKAFKMLDAAGWNNQGNALYDIGRYREAIACYDKEIEANPKDEAAWYNKGRALYNLDKHHEAIVCFDRAIEIDPRDATAWLGKGFTIDSLGKYQDAIVCYDKAIEINPREAAAWNNKGHALYNLDKHQEAIVCFDRAIEIDPRDATAWFALFTKGGVLSELGKHHEAIACYDKAIEIDPREAAAWSNKGSALNNLGKQYEAIACYDKAIEINPREAAAWNNKGHALSNLGRHHEAIACYDKAIEIDPRDATAWYNKGRVLSELGKHQEAIEAFENYIKFVPANQAADVATIKELIQTLKAKTGKKGFWKRLLE